MGLTGMHFLLDYFAKHSLFPGITAGLRNVERDEHRHVAYGTWFLRNDNSGGISTIPTFILGDPGDRPLRLGAGRDSLHRSGADGRPPARCGLHRGE